jgi:N,N'-diacetyllegionaminate synthase
MKDIHIIAEAGSNYNGKLEYAMKLSSIAKEAGADSVKFQMINTWELYLPGKYEYGHYNIADVIKIRLRDELKETEYIKLSKYCKKIGIPFAASVFDEKGLAVLDRLNPPYIKAASCDLNNIRLLLKMAETGRKLVLSTGMSTMGEIEKTVTALVKHNHNDIVLMHCVSVYPATTAQANISMIDVLKHNFGFPVGFSDHTGTSIAACMALTKGATWFEKHFTFDKTLSGLDHKYAQDAEELKKYVSDLREAQKALKLRVVKVSDDEKYTRKRARRSLYAARDIKAGEVIKEKDVLVVRPENIMSADQIEEIVGKKAKKSIRKYEPFSMPLIEI